jgi:hypothetical protein
MFLLDADRLPMLDHADELDQEAEALEREDGEAAAGDKRSRRRKPG